MGMGSSLNVRSCVIDHFNGDPFPALQRLESSSSEDRRDETTLRI